MYSKSSRGKYSPLLPTALQDLDPDHNINRIHTNSNRDWKHIIKTCLIRLTLIVFFILFLFLMVKNKQVFGHTCSRIEKKSSA